MAIGLLAAAALVGYVVVTLLPPETFGGAAPQIEWARKQFAAMQGWEPLLGGWERLGALVIQVALAVLVLQAFTRGRRWWWYALAAHTLVDFSSVAVLHLTVKAWGQTAAMLLTEGLVTVYALAALWVIVACARRKGRRCSGGGRNNPAAGLAHFRVVKGSRRPRNGRSSLLRWRAARAEGSGRGTFPLACASGWC